MILIIVTSGSQGRLVKFNVRGQNLWTAAQQGFNFVRLDAQ
jgi:hypothetical protein